jgi:hypothetical protein
MQEIQVVLKHTSVGHPCCNIPNIQLGYDSGLIFVLLWCCSGYNIVYMTFLASYLCSAYYFISGILQVLSEHLPRQKIVG